MRVVQNSGKMLILSVIMFSVIAFTISGCATGDINSGEPTARGGTNEDGDFVWVSKANILLAGDIIRHDVWCKNMTRLFQPELAFLKMIPIVMAPYTTNSFGQWETSDEKNFIIKSELQYQSQKNRFVLTNPTFYSIDDSTTIQLQTTKKNGEKFIVKIRNGESIKNNKYLKIDGGIKPPSPE